MKPLVHPELSTAAVGSSQAPTAAVDNSAPFATHPKSTYKSGKVVQTNGATSVDPLRTWGPILKGVADEIGKMPESTPAEKTKKEDYWRIHGHLSAVKNAWRNPTMHPRKSYDVEEAEDIFCATRGFLRDIARVVP